MTNHPYLIQPHPEKPFLFVGDIQGDATTVRLVEDLTDRYVPVFVGDYLDNWRYSSVTQADGLRHVLDMIDAGKAYGMRGNHEMSYLAPRKCKCGGYKDATATFILPEHTRMWRLLRPFAVIETGTRPIVVSHAGITKPFWDRMKGDQNQKFAAIFDMSRDLDSAFYDVGTSRDGSALIPGPLWCDWHADFESVPEVRQIVGHSANWAFPYGFSDQEVIFPTKWMEMGNHKGILKTWPKRDRGLRRTPNGDWNIDCIQFNQIGLGYDPKTDTFEGVAL